MVVGPQDTTQMVGSNLEVDDDAGYSPLFYAVELALKICLVAVGCVFISVVLASLALLGVMMLVWMGLISTFITFTSGKKSFAELLRLWIILTCTFASTFFWMVIFGLINYHLHKTTTATAMIAGAVIGLFGGWAFGRISSYFILRILYFIKEKFAVIFGSKKLA
ncbi:MAG: hypothetical protein JWO06_223 [Bacteroidota bacterium]|nr:hypothetical protein [Bacteroidota bacterium]